MSTFLYIFFGYLSLLLLITTFRLFKYDGYDKTQKLIQLLIIWLIPILGVVAVAHFLDDEIEIKEAKTYVPIRLLSLLYLAFMVSSSIDTTSSGNDDYTYSAYESSGGGTGGEV